MLVQPKLAAKPANEANDLDLGGVCLKLVGKFSPLGCNVLQALTQLDIAPFIFSKALRGCCQLTSNPRMFTCLRCAPSISPIQ